MRHGGGGRDNHIGRIVTHLIDWIDNHSAGQRTSVDHIFDDFVHDWYEPDHNVELFHFRFR